MAVACIIGIVTGALCLSVGYAIAVALLYLFDNE